ncbi:MAG: response regulator [Chloroflexota bacterium]|nr:response regulator [Chloroflexota bacterium]
MSKGRILVVEDDFDISNMLRIYFDSQGYDVIVAPRGGDALELCRRKLPNIVVLDIQLPDIDGYEVCRQLRGNLRTSHIPIIFLTQRDERSDKIAGLELGADDYITKPFDIEELRLRVQNALRRATYESMTSPTTGLPSGKLIEEQLKLLMSKKGWTILYVGINGLEPFNEAYGFVAGNDVLRFTGLILSEAVDEVGTTSDFIGHVGGDDFIIITESGEPERLRDAIVERFDEGVRTFYSFRDREAGHMMITDPTGQEQQVPLMTLSIGLVYDDTTFADIREITEIASEARRQAVRR